MNPFSTLFRYSLFLLECCALSCYGDTTLIIDKLPVLGWLAAANGHSVIQAEKNTSQPIQPAPEPGQAFELSWKLPGELLTTPSLILCAAPQRGLQLATSGKVAMFISGDVIRYQIKPYSQESIQTPLVVRVYDPENLLLKCSGFSDGRNVFLGLGQTPDKNARGKASAAYVSLSVSGQLRWTLYSSGSVAGIPMAQWGNTHGRGSVAVGSRSGMAGRPDTPYPFFSQPPAQPPAKPGKKGAEGGDDPNQPGKDQLHKKVDSGLVNEVAILLQSLLMDEDNIELLALRLLVELESAVAHTFLVAFARQNNNPFLPGLYGIETWIKVLGWLAGHSSQVNAFVNRLSAFSKPDYDAFVRVLYEFEEEIIEEKDDDLIDSTSL